MGNKHICCSKQTGQTSGPRVSVRNKTIRALSAGPRENGRWPTRSRSASPEPNSIRMSPVPVVPLAWVDFRDIVLSPKDASETGLACSKDRRWYGERQRWVGERTFIGKIIFCDLLEFYSRMMEVLRIQIHSNYMIQNTDFGAVQPASRRHLPSVESFQP